MRERTLVRRNQAGQDSDALFVDSIGYNEGFWFERMGLPHTESVHIVEYFRRRGADTIEYTFVLNDPTAYDAPTEAHLSVL